MKVVGVRDDGAVLVTDGDGGAVVLADGRVFYNPAGSILARGGWEPAPDGTPIPDGIDADRLAAAHGAPVFGPPGPAVDKSARAVATGHDQLHHYWTRGEGLAKWADTPHPWTALYHHLLKYLPDDEAKRTAAQWFHDVKGYWPGDQKGHNPVGPG